MPHMTEDDFILTISDNDDIPSIEADSHSKRASSPKAPRNLLRNKQKTKRTKKTKPLQQSARAKALNGAKTSNGQEADSGEEEGAEDDEDVDDGVLNPDFEFQVADPYATLGDSEGVFAEYDGNLNTNGINSDGAKAKYGDKKGVDIDELIARKRAKVNGTPKLHASSAMDVDLEDGDGDESGDDREYSDNESAEDDEADFDEMDEDDDDELLAADGFGMGAGLHLGDEPTTKDTNGNDSEADSASDSDMAVGDEMPEPDVSDGDSDSDRSTGPSAAEQARRDAFFAPAEPVSAKASATVHNSFQEFSLSRPILRGLTSVGFTTPTPIQKKTIPVALLGKDIVGGAVTGSGKTGAFMIPILERLLYRPKKVPTSRVVILMPTRELAVQCFNVARKLASFTDITFCQLVGGFSVREQEAVLRTRPDVIIATPGRFIDHMRNSASFTIDTLEILVLDEADRMLEDGFADELNEILTTIPRSRQTMLFSATMTESIDRLVRAGLNRPVRLLVDATKQTVTTLTQEFLRIRPGREHLRMSYLVYLCQAVYTDRVIVFFRQKKEAHRARVIFGLLGLKAAELHGSMSQEQRIQAINAFTSNSATHLLATDLASRGLDIPSVATVINYEAPQSHEIYLHRVGRTARAGRLGRSCTLAAETDRKVVKQVVRSSRGQNTDQPASKLLSRTIEPASLIDSKQQELVALEGEIEEILKMEQEEKLLSQQAVQIERGENLILHEDEIKARPKRTWFESESDRRGARKRGRVELNGPEDGGGTPADKAVRKLLVQKQMRTVSADDDGSARAVGKRKLSGKDRKALDDRRDRVGGKLWKKGKGDLTAAGAVADKSTRAGGKTRGRGGARGRGRGRDTDTHTRDRDSSAGYRVSKTGAREKRDRSSGASAGRGRGRGRGGASGRGRRH